MIVVLDIDVVVSALLACQGAPAEIMRRWEADAFGVVTSPPLIGELERAPGYPGGDPQSRRVSGRARAGAMRETPTNNALHLTTYCLDYPAYIASDQTINWGGLASPAAGEAESFGGLWCILFE
jgi:hypothetical protein